MGIISKKVYVKWTPINKKWFVAKGYVFTKINELITVKVEDLSNGSGIKVKVQCDNCNNLLSKRWVDYISSNHKYGSFFFVKHVQINYLELLKAKKQDLEKVRRLSSGAMIIIMLMF